MNAKQELTLCETTLEAAYQLRKDAASLQIANETFKTIELLMARKGELVSIVVEEETTLAALTANIKINKFNITNKVSKLKAKVHYSAYRQISDNRLVAVAYAKDYSNDLAKMFPENYINNSNGMMDYFETGKVVFFEDHPLYEQIKARAEA